jgi:hypothetical protein
VSLRNISGASLTRLIVPCADPTEPVAECHGIPAMSRQRRWRCGRRRKHRAAVDAVAILRRIESPVDAIRRQTPTGVSRRASPLGRLPPARNLRHWSNILAR